VESEQNDVFPSGLLRPLPPDQQDRSYWLELIRCHQVRALVLRAQHQSVRAHHVAGNALTEAAIL
jgi:hypothetical protein